MGRRSDPFLCQHDKLIPALTPQLSHCFSTSTSILTNVHVLVISPKILSLSFSFYSHPLFWLTALTTDRGAFTADRGVCNRPRTMQRL